MVRYLKDCCGFFHLRYAVICIALLEMSFSIYFIQDGIEHSREFEIEAIRKGNSSLPSRNATSHDGGTRVSNSKNDGALITVALVGSLNILVAFSLFICGVVNKPYLRMLLIVWICWAFAVVVLAFAIIIFYLTIAHSFLDGLRVFMVYGIGILLKVLCIWVVASYFRYLGIMARGPAQGYRVVFNSRGAEPHHMHQERSSVTSEPPSYATSVHSIASLEIIEFNNANTNGKVPL